jgi:hypothetical protein
MLLGHFRRCFWGVQAMAVDGLTTIRSSHGPKDTMNRLEAAVNAKGLTVFARMITRRGPRRSDYRCGRPKSAQTIGVDLPLKHWFGRMRPAKRGFHTMIPVGSRNGTGSATRLTLR